MNHDSVQRVRSGPCVAGARTPCCCRGRRRAQQEPIRIGAFLSVTGPAAFLGDPELKTLEM